MRFTAILTRGTPQYSFTVNMIFHGRCSGKFYVKLN